MWLCRLSAHLNHILRESGWREKTMQACIKALREGDGACASYGLLYQRVEGDAVEGVPEGVRREVVRRVREVLEGVVDV